MRLGRLVAAGLVVGAAAGFAGGLLRPRTVRTYGADTGRAPAVGDLAADPAGAAVPEDDAVGTAEDAAEDPETADSARSAARVVDVDGLAAVEVDPEAGRRVVATGTRARGDHH